MAPVSPLLIKRLISEQPAEFILVDIRQVASCIGLSRTFFTPVARYIPFAVAKPCYGEHTVVFAAFTSGVGSIGFKSVKSICCRQGGHMAIFPFRHRIESAAVGSHDPGNVRSYHFFSQDLFYSSQHRFV